MGVPNLFLLGAGKSGTTTLYQILQRHPDIHVCDPKEPSFFCSHFQVIQNPVAYFRLFDSERRYRVDASHVYFSNPETPPLLHDLFPSAKFLLILREPKARAHSLYQHMRRALHSDGLPIEPIESFLEALIVENERFSSPKFAATCRHYFWNFMYIRSSFYDEQLLRYLKLFPMKQFLFITLANLHHQPEDTLSEIAQFLDLDVAGFGQEVPVANAGPIYETFTPQCAALMERYFGDLTTRVDALVGRSLDWSL
ncbi:sulfotransferase [Rhodospirillum rubrum F11]|uniref:Sulfotransferase n=1 Tax=Rhodospirillum rubrum (strain ATCC 11170 / ATH 1.1.1 / DSM 467 / LMG 4362 / NCIMB 8255 / S1) TaxID=269796 RepID=Q2RP41_RHORT|nr:sulfotransferase domain-containing protein [Rhodospirillum rubrum]ABC24104.1 Sulfotransferase [Rhodospirillum rubrum ATCC 11170]AEO49850.1 sulfotransferase [Rhodospirillum rubrum F11]MBK5955814.1 sulfotransferase [Rhodospirillum rubrum]QXG80045.1 sulfotransferase domain-containing protein [Rhodospirillum rubrum]